MRGFGLVPLSVLLLAAFPVAGRAQGQLLGEVHRMLPPVESFTASIALGDVDGDGDLDALLGNGSPYGLPEQNRLFLSDGAGRFTDATSQLPAIADATACVASGDVDGDGDLDAYVANTGQDRLLLNGGSGAFTDATAQLPSVIDYSQGVAMGDLDGDGDLDVLVGNDGQNGLYLDNGAGLFTDASLQLPLYPYINHSTAVALGDVDGDGDLDTLIGNGNYGLGQADRLFLNNGSATFASATGQLPVIVDDTRAVALGDVDGDGDLDALLGSGAIYTPGQQSRLYLNGGSGVFADATAQLPVALDQARSAALGDVDGDGDLDALIGNYEQQSRLALNNGAGIFADATAQLPAVVEDTRALALGDVDGDGDLDALIGNGEEERAVADLYLNDGAGSFTQAGPPLSAIPDYTRAVALGDLDGDGDVDALVANSPDPSRIFLNDGAGSFADGTAGLPPVPGSFRVVALGDVDGDGDLDAAIGMGPVLQQVRLYLNNGPATFTDASLQMPSLASLVEAIALADMDGDGDLDAVIGNSSPAAGPPAPQVNRLYLNNGAGVFASSSGALSSAQAWTRDLALGDMDGDGDLDIWVGNYGSASLLYLNNGSAAFLAASPLLPPIVSPVTSVALADVDGDGDLDSFVGNYQDQNRLYLNGGTGVFTDVTATNVPTLIANTQAVGLGDFDGDGDVDALIGNGAYYQTPQNRLYLNDGSGDLADATPLLPARSDRTQALALADLDGDGDLDAWTGNQGKDAVLANLSRQLGWRGIPRIGKPLTMDLNGPAWGGWFLGFSLGTASIPIPPLGVLRLDPASLSFLLGGLLDADGRASVTYPVPANPSLLGATAYWQAVVAGPARFTNLEITTLTNL